MFDLLNVRYKTVTDQRSHLSAWRSTHTALPRLWFAYRTSIAKSDEEVLASMNGPAFHHGDLAVLEKDPGVPVSPPPDGLTGSARITRYEINSMDAEVETPSRGVLVFSEIYYPGWRAFVDGHETEVFRADYDLRGIIVEAGRHSVSMKFEPASFSLGALWNNRHGPVLCVRNGGFSPAFSQTDAHLKDGPHHDHHRHSDLQ